MASASDNISMALFCDFENVALGVRDAQYEKFDIKPVLERLLVKGSIVVKKAYCDWDRYKAFKAAMHEANFELIEIPHVRQSGKNSADIRLVVDALDLCYTKAHVDTFVIISGDSDFSPLVSKLRENAKQVIGVGVKQSTSDLLIANCDEFIFYDDLVRDRETKRKDNRKDGSRDGNASNARRGEDDRKRKEDLETRRSMAIELAMATFDDLMAERSDTEKLWASVLKEAIKRRNPGFNESYYGFKAFGNLLEEAQNRGLISFGRDEKSGAYVFRSSNPLAPPAPEAEPTPAPAADVRATPVATQIETPVGIPEKTPADTPDSVPAAAVVPAAAPTPTDSSIAEAPPARKSRSRTRSSADKNDKSNKDGKAEKTDQANASSTARPSRGKRGATAEDSLAAVAVDPGSALTQTASSETALTPVRMPAEAVVAAPEQTAGEAQPSLTPSKAQSPRKTPRQAATPRSRSKKSAAAEGAAATTEEKS